jgi:hypothetical protein
LAERRVASLQTAVQEHRRHEPLPFSADWYEMAHIEPLVQLLALLHLHTEKEATSG